VQFADGHLHGFGDLVRTGAAVENRGEMPADALGFAGTGPHRPGGPVHGPQLVLESATDTDGREVCEWHAPVRVEAFGADDERQHGCGAEVVDVDVHRQGRGSFAGQVYGQR
jgi:hypothetical protein